MFGLCLNYFWGFGGFLESFEVFLDFAGDFHTNFPIILVSVSST